MTAPTEVQTITATDSTVYGPDLQPVPAPMFTQPTDPDGDTVPAAAVTAAAPVDPDRQAHAREIEQLLRGRVQWYSTNRPRSLQRKLGPSEVGTPCIRQLAYKRTGAVDPVNLDGGDPWASFVGTATHAELDLVFRGSPQEWLTEQRVVIDAELDLAGSTDLVKLTDGGDVIDHKVVGVDRIRKARKYGPGAQYRTQVHLYGHGLVQKGIAVEWVSIAFWPRSGRLSELYVWTERYDQQVAEAALQRLVAIDVLHGAVGPALFGQLPIADAYCQSCPWFMPGQTDAAIGCGGAPRDGGR